jgi:hypothetical protein
VTVRGDLISATAVAKSGRVLCAFSYFYLPFYGFSPRDVFWRFDPFAWISSVVYDIDEQIELGRSPDLVLRRLDDLAAYVSARAKLDSSVLRLLEDARRYYRFEFDVAQREAHYSFGELAQIVGIRSFDFRLMHRVLAQQSGMGYRETLFDWFRAFEMLMEIEDDIGSVEEDGERRTFNVVCLATRRDSCAGITHVEKLRGQVDDDLRVREEQLSAEERFLCASTLKAYREIVARPVLPRCSMGASRLDP